VSDLIGRIEHSIRTRRLLKYGQAILLAVSGGSDSMVMLHALHDLCQQYSWHLTVAHLNHRLRGRSSDADERLVVRTARQLRLPCVAGHVDVKKFARAHKLSIEMAARELRHGFLARTATRLKIPAVDKTILRLMDIVGNEADFVDEAAGEWMNSRHPTAFGRLALAVQRRCIQLQLLRQKIPMDYDLVERLRMEPERPIEFAPRRTVSRDSAGQLHVRELKSSRSDSREIKVRLNGTAGSVVFNRTKFQWRIVARKYSGRLRTLAGHEYFDADKLGSSVVLRHWRPGDRFQPIGMFSAVKLQDLFTNQKIPKDHRHQLVLAVTAAGEVFWVERLRISDRFKLSGETIRRLHWRWKRL
jgi:tRNA(Ile)-lysidine synthetase-like protein